MINEEILSMLGERYGLIGSAYYARIAEWESWWKGYNHAFHEFWENAVGGVPVKRRLYRMNMAKKICEDWASLLLNDRTVVTVEDECGQEFVRKWMNLTDFMAQANRLVEKAFALGTGAAILRLAGEADEDGILKTGCGVAFDFVDAAHIVPISIQNGTVTEAAFVSESIVRGEEVLYLELHTLEEDGYVITNEFYVRENGKLVKRENPSCAEMIRTGSKTPLFAILTPNIQNSIDEGCGLGMSVFADALDCLRGVDLAFNNFCRDIKLGGKKVFINQSLIERDDAGNVFTPDDVAQQLFVTIGDTDLAENPMIVEHNPELRTGENADAVQCQLNYLSFRCGLGSHHYTFGDMGGRARLTATQYMGERQDMRQNAVKHQKNVARFLTSAVRALLWCGRAVWGLPMDETAPVRITFDDSYFTDAESCRARDLQELQAGVLTAEEYRNKWIGGDANA